jgi:type IV secretory pathway component VirB8
MLDNTYNNNVDNILNNYTKEKQQRYKMLINNYNYAKKNSKEQLTIINYSNNLNKRE